MQLYILGPAFGLPSIDAECNAAVALLQLRVRNNYEIIPTHRNAERLPHLIDGGSQLWGFGNIARYLCDKRISHERWRLSPKQQNNAIAITAFLEAKAHTLLDISLYVSFENYRHVTRPAFTTILPWHTNYILPPYRRASARTRTEHLGIASIDVDDVHEDLSNRPAGAESIGKEQEFGEAMQKRASILLPSRKDTLLGMLRKPEHAATFKLHALAENFFDPVQELLQNSGSYLLDSEEPSAVDCLLFGFLALMFYPKMPHDWLAATLRRKYPKLVAYTEQLYNKLGVATHAEDVCKLKASQTVEEVREVRQLLKLSLPWRAPEQPKIAERVHDIRIAVQDTIPVLGTSSQLQLWYAPGRPLLEELLPKILISTSAIAAAIGFLAFQQRWVAWPTGEAVHIFGRKRFSDFGAVHDMLAGVNLMSGGVR